MMGDIYSKAKLVLVWLGLEGENSAEVFDSIQIDYSLTLFELKLRVALHYFVQKEQPFEGILRFCRLVDQMVCSPGEEEQPPAIEPILFTQNNKFAETRKGFGI
jgi:hypothetical protein